MKTITLQITDDGEVLFEGQKLTTRSATRGYQHITLAVHRLVAHAFHGCPSINPKDYVVHHKDGNPRNNHPKNLQWMTQAENTRESFSRKPRVLTADQVREILAHRPKNVTTLTELAKQYGVSYSAVRQVRNGLHFNGKAKSNRQILTDVEIEHIKNWQPHKPTSTELARRYKVSKTVILNIWHGKY